MDRLAVATWKGGFRLVRLQDQPDPFCGDWKMRFALEGREEMGTLQIEVEQWPEGIRYRNPFECSLDPEKMPGWMYGMLLWYFRATGLLPDEGSDGVEKRLFLRKLGVGQTYLPGRLPDAGDGLSDVPGVPRTADEIKSLVIRTIAGASNKVPVEKVYIATPRDRRETGVVGSFILWIGTKAFQTQPWSRMISDLGVRIREKDGRVWFTAHNSDWSRPGDEIPADRPTLASALREFLSDSRYLSPADWYAEMDALEFPGELAVAPEELDVLRLLGEPCPLVLPWEELMAWISDRD